MGSDVVAGKGDLRKGERLKLNGVRGREGAEAQTRKSMEGKRWWAGGREGSKMGTEGKRRWKQRRDGKGNGEEAGKDEDGGGRESRKPRGTGLRGGKSRRKFNESAAIPFRSRKWEKRKGFSVKSIPGTSINNVRGMGTWHHACN